MPTATEMRPESILPDSGAWMFLADETTPRVLGGAGLTERDRPEPPFWAGAADAFGSGWPTPEEEVRRWS